jgi:succinate dehydrogenase/fumarate reductase flavoprotein subunit
MVGAEIIYNIQKAVKKYEQSGMVQIMLDTRVTSLKKDENGTVVGVEVTTKTLDGEMKNMTLTSPNVILATGGFASDRRHGSYLEKYRPELMKMPATAGEFSTGDGIALGTSVGAGLVDMEKVQVHPTGWVDPKHPTNPGKILAGELMRGVGGILINQSGKRYVTTGINHIILSASPSSNASFTPFPGSLSLDSATNLERGHTW